MKTKLIPIILAFASLAALGQDSTDKMTSNIVGTKAAPNYEPHALSSHAVVDKNNKVQINAYSGILDVVASTAGDTRVSVESVATLTSATTVSLAPTQYNKVFKITPGSAITFNAVKTNAVKGRTYLLVITTTGTTSRTLTFGTNFKTTGTLATGTTDAKVFVVQFVYDGTNFNEVSRTTAM